MGITVNFTDNSAQVLQLFETAVQRGLMACGSNAEGYGKQNLTDQNAVDTGRLRNSISHAMNGDRTVQIGTNVEYGIYIECGTGQYATTGGGTTKKSWVYRGDDGKLHMAFPQRARPYLKPAVADHGDEFRNLIKESLKNA